MAGPLLVHDGALIQGDKFLYSLDEILDSQYRVAKLYAFFGSGPEALNPVFVTSPSSGYLESLGGRVIFVLVYSRNTGETILQGVSLQGVEWERTLPNAWSVNVSDKIDVLAANPIASGYLTESKLSLYSYIDGTTGNTKRSYTRQDFDELAPDKDGILPGFDYAMDHRNQTIDGWRYSANPNGWSFAWVDEDNRGQSLAPEDGFPEITKKPKMWSGAGQAFAGEFKTFEYVRVTSSGFILFQADVYSWSRTKTTPGYDYGTGIYESESFMAAVQYATSFVDGEPLKTEITFKRVVRVYQWVSIPSLYGSGQTQFRWEFDTLSNTGQQVYFPGEPVLPGQVANDVETLRTSTAQGEIWAYATRPQDEGVKRIHKFNNDGTIKDSIPVAYQVSNRVSATILLTDKSRYFLLRGGPGNGFVDSMYRSNDGSEFSPQTGSVDDEIVQVYVVDSTEIVQIRPVPSDVKGNNSYYQMWISGDNPGPWEMAAKALSFNGGSRVYLSQSRYPGSAAFRYDASTYIGNGISLGKPTGFPGGAPQTYAYRLDDLRAGSSVAYILIPRTITRGGVEYTINGQPCTRRPEWGGRDGVL
jgi:hypothetical protein